MWYVVSPTKLITCGAIPTHGRLVPVSAALNNNHWSGGLLESNFRSFGVSSDRRLNCFQEEGGYAAWLYLTLLWSGGVVAGITRTVSGSRSPQPLCALRACSRCCRKHSSHRRVAALWEEVGFCTLCMEKASPAYLWRHRPHVYVVSIGLCEEQVQRESWLLTLV